MTSRLHVRFDTLCILIPEEPEQGSSTGASLWKAFGPVKNLLSQGWNSSNGNNHPRRHNSNEGPGVIVSEDGLLLLQSRGRSTSTGTSRRPSLTSSSRIHSHSPENLKSCLKMSTVVPLTPGAAVLPPGAFPAPPSLSHNSSSGISAYSHHQLPLLTAPLSECCEACQQATDLALQLGPAYKIQWTHGAAVKKKRDDAEEQKDILDGFKRNCQKWREIIPEEIEDDGFSNPLVDAEDVEVSGDEDEEGSDECKHPRTRTGARRALSKLDGLGANTARHKTDAQLNKAWQPTKYYNDEDDEEDLFPLPSPITSPRIGSPNPSSANLGETGNKGLPSLPSITGSTTHSLSGSDEGVLSSRGPSPLHNSISAEDVDTDSTSPRESAEDHTRKPSSPLLTYTSPSKPRKPKINIPITTDSQDSLGHLSEPPSSIPSAHQLNPYTLGGEKLEPIRSRSVSPAHSPRVSAIDSERSPTTTMATNSALNRMSSQNSGPRPSPIPPSVTSSSSRSSGNSSGRLWTSGGFVPPPLPQKSNSFRRNGPSAIGTGKLTDNPKMPTYSGAQREVVIIASSRNGERERERVRNGTDSNQSTLRAKSRQDEEASWRDKERERDLELAAAAVDRRVPPAPRHDSSSTVTMNGSGERTPQLESDLSLERMETITSRSAPTVLNGRQVPPRSSTLQSVQTSGAQTPPHAPNEFGLSSRSQPKPANVLRKAGAGTDLHVFRPPATETTSLSSKPHRHQLPQQQQSTTLLTSSAPAPKQRVPSLPSPPQAPALIQSGGDANRNRSQSIRKLWRGVIGGRAS